MKVEEAVVAAETAKIVVERAELEDIVAAGNYYESLFVAVPE
jgi:hypothetical protein